MLIWLCEIKETKPNKKLRLSPCSKILAIFNPAQSLAKTVGCNKKMNINILTYLAILILIYYGFRGIYSFLKNDKKEHFQNGWDFETANTSIVKKTVGRDNYIRYQNIYWGMIFLILGIAILIHEITKWIN